MSSTSESFRSFSYEDAAASARWYKKDLEKGGWRVVYDEAGSKCWIKTFPEMEVPVKFLIQHKLPIAAEQVIEVLLAKNIKFRQTWDKGFVDNEVLEEYPNDGGYVLYNRVKTSWPLADRDFVLFRPSPKEIDWFGKRALFTPSVNAWHPSKPANASRYVRATNGGNLAVLIPDETNPENACTMFVLSHNNFNGWVPNRHIEWLMAPRVPPRIITYLNGMVEGSKMLSEK